MTLPPSEVHRMARDFGRELREKCAVAPAAFAMAGLSEAERRAVMSLALSDVVCAFGQSLGLRSRDTLREIDPALDRARRLLEQRQQRVESAEQIYRFEKFDKSRCR